MQSVCHHTAAGAGNTHKIANGDRCLDLRFDVDWGDKDLRESHSKPLTFCSFTCLAAWATDRAAQHDGTTLTEGT